MYFIKTYDMKKGLLSIVVICLMVACIWKPTNTEESTCRQAKAFAEAYFNYDFEEAGQRSTPESAKWLQFASSSITQEDVDFINSQEAASVTVSNCSKVNDSISIVTIVVDHFVTRDSIGSPAHITNEATFNLKVVLRNGDYLIKMEGLPQNEMQSLD